MQQVRFSQTGAAVASLCAGPVFLAALAAAAYVGAIPRPITLEADEIGSAIMIFAPAVFFGFILAILPNLIASTLLASFAERAAWLRTRAAWVGIGAAAGYGIARLFAVSDGGWIFALTATAATCAAICRCFLRVE